MFYKFVLFVVNLPFRILFPFKVYGKENIPKGKVIIAGNHSSNADVVMVLLTLPWDNMSRIIGKTELFQWKPMGWFLTQMGAFPVDRSKNDIVAVKKCLSTLKEEKRLIIFPEGTRVKDEAVGAKNGAALFAMRTDSPVLPVYLTKGKKLFRRTKVIFGKPYHIEGDYKDQELLAKRATEMMESIYLLGEKDEH